MYSQPKSTSNSKQEEPAPTAGSSCGEDADVQDFWRRLKGQTDDLTGSTEMGPTASALNSGKKGESDSGTAGRNFTHKQSSLEKEVGLRAGEFLNRAQLEERHPRLKNAPVEGAYTDNIPLNHKPFYDVIRNVRCMRCGEWGHALGDRECPLLHEVSAAEIARQRKDDPINSMKGEDFLENKQKLILSSAVRARHGTSMPTVSVDLPENQRLIESDEEGIRYVTLSCTYCAYTLI